MPPCRRKHRLLFGERDEAKAAGATCLAIHHDHGVCDGTKPLEELTKSVLRHLGREAADEALEPAVVPAASPRF